jgi:hypothetical protein
MYCMTAERNYMNNYQIRHWVTSSKLAAIIADKAFNLSK